MTRGDKRHYTSKQKRQAKHIEEGMQTRGLTPHQAAARAWATVNAIHGGGELKGGGGYGKPENKAIYRKAGRKGGRALKERAALGRTRKGSTGRRSQTRRPSRSR